MFFRIDPDNKNIVAGRRLASAAVKSVAATAIFVAAVFAVTLFAPVTVDLGGGNLNIVALKSANAKNDKEVDHAAPWLVVASTGSVRYRLQERNPVDWQAVSTGLTIEPYAEFETGADGRLVLFNGEDQMILAPNSVVALHQAVAGVPDITILQSAGQVNYEVENRREPTGLFSKIGQMFLSGSRPKGRFDVHTPHLVAAVNRHRDVCFWL